MKMKMPDPASFQPFPDEAYLPAGTAPTQLYRMVKAAYDSDAFTIDGFAEALLDYEEAIQIMRAMTSPPDRERQLVLDIAQGAKAYRSAKAALLAARAAFQTLPPHRAQETVLYIADVFKPHNSAKASLLAAQESLADIESCFSRIVDKILGHYCPDPVEFFDTADAEFEEDD
jgi:hypothetical protein